MRREGAPRASDNPWSPWTFAAQLPKANDFSLQDRAAKLDYDFAERPVQAELWEGGDLAYHLAQGYDEFNQPGELTENVRESATSRTVHKTRCQYDIEGRPTTLEYESRAIAQIANAAEGPVTYPDTPAKQVVYKEGTATDDVHAQVSAPGYVPNAATPKRYVGYTYDKLGRIGARRVGADTKSRMLMETSYGFLKGATTENTTGLVERISQLGSSTYYRYDNVGNIIQETRGFSPIPFADMQGTVTNGTPDSTQPTNHPARDQQGNLLLGTSGITYEYDALGQLTRVNDEYASETWTYEYDQGGNLLAMKRYAYTAETLGTVLQTVPSTYGNPNWKDQLTAYNGKAITYDAIGNPLTYDGWLFTWKAGRMLERMLKLDMKAMTRKEVTFTYDHTGLRVKKSFNGTDTLYTLNGKKITHVRKQVNGENIVRMHFFYDAQGRPSIIRYNDVDYAYVHNLQGDVIAIVDMDGNKVVEYGYDAWGKPTGKTGTLAGTLGADNPFRYRGYVWDEETGVYYLRSRYYIPEWGRFINADVVMGKAGKLLDHNTFSYCRQNPVMGSDPSGMYDEDARMSGTGHLISDSKLRTKPSEKSLTVKRRDKKGSVNVIINAEGVVSYTSERREDDEGNIWVSVKTTIKNRDYEGWMLAKFIVGDERCIFDGADLQSSFETKYVNVSSYPISNVHDDFLNKTGDEVVYFTYYCSEEDHPSRVEKTYGAVGVQIP